MKKIIIFLIILLVPSFVFAFEVVQPSDEFYVNDYANILSKETEDYIISKNKYLSAAGKGAQIVVVTVNGLDGANIEEYATKLFREFGIGDKDENNGLLFLIDMRSRKTRVEVGYGLEGILNDAYTGRVQDQYMIPYFKDNDFDKGITEGFNVFYLKICDMYGIEANGVYVHEKESESIFSFLLVMIIMLFVQFIISSILYSGLNNEDRLLSTTAILIEIGYLGYVRLFHGEQMAFYALVLFFSFFVQHFNIRRKFRRHFDTHDITIHDYVSNRSSGGRSHGGGGRSGGGGSTRGF